MAGRRTSKPPDHIAARLQRFRERMSLKKIKAYLLTNRMDSFYLTGCTAEDSALLVTPKQLRIISDGRFRDSIDEECPWIGKDIRRGSLVAQIAKVCRRLRLLSLAVQGDVVSVDIHRELRKACKPAKLTIAPPIVNQLRRIKDDFEIKAIENASRVAEAAFRSTCRSIRIGQTEQAIAARLEYEMRKRGASEAAFPSIVAEGPNAALPHAFPGERRVAAGSMLLLDWGACVGFYRSDLTRVVGIHRMPPRIAKIYRIVLEAQEKAIAAIRPGRRARDVDAVARAHIRKAGFGKEFSHGLGHGLGLDVHESPRLGHQSKDVLEAGMVVTVEPGVYVKGVGGVRIEDDVLVTADGARVLTRLNKDLASAIV